MRGERSYDLLGDLWAALEGDVLFSTDAVGIDLSNGPIERWVQFAPRGTINHPKFGKIEFSQKMLTELKTNFDNKVYGIDICLDREHAVDGDTRALGWYKAMEIRDDGLWALIQFTDEGVEQIYRKKAYRYFSPMYGPVEKPDGTIIMNVPKGGAATNRPFVKTMGAMTALTEFWVAPEKTGVTLTASTSTNTPQGVHMPDKPAVSTPAAPATPPAAAPADVKLSELMERLDTISKANVQLSEQNAKLIERNEAADKALTAAAVEGQITRWSNLEVQLTETDSAGAEHPGKKVKVGIPPVVAQKYRDFKLTDKVIPIEEFISDLLTIPAVILSEMGNSFSQEGDHPDATKAPVATGDNVIPILGLETVRMSEEFGKAQGWDMTLAENIEKALLAVEGKTASRGATASSY